MVGGTSGWDELQDVYFHGYYYVPWMSEKSRARIEELVSCYCGAWFDRGLQEELMYLVDDKSLSAAILLLIAEAAQEVAGDHQSDVEALLYGFCADFEPTSEMSKDYFEWDRQTLDGVAGQLEDLKDKYRLETASETNLAGEELETGFPGLAEILVRQPKLRKMVQFIAHKQLALELGERVDDQYRLAFEMLEQLGFFADRPDIGAIARHALNREWALQQLRPTLVAANGSSSSSAEHQQVA